MGGSLSSGCRAFPSESGLSLISSLDWDSRVAALLSALTVASLDGGPSFPPRCSLLPTVVLSWVSVAVRYPTSLRRWSCRLMARARFWRGLRPMRLISLVWTVCLEPGSTRLARMAPGGHHKLPGRCESGQWCDVWPPVSSFSSRDGARRASQTAEQLELVLR